MNKNRRRQLKHRLEHAFRHQQPSLGIHVNENGENSPKKEEGLIPELEDYRNENP
jgi:hypothetical protein